MERRTATRIEQLPSFEQLDKRLTREWDFESDPAGAVKTAITVMGILEIRFEEIDPACDYSVVCHAAEVLWDSERFEECEHLVDLWREVVIQVCDAQHRDPTEARIWSAILTARFQHRLGGYASHAGAYEIAIGYVTVAINEIRELAGGADELEEMLDQGAVNPITELYAAALAIGIPAARMRFAGMPALRVQYLDRWVGDALRLLDRDMPPPLLRIHAVIIQTYFAIAERSRNANNEALLDRLERFDDLCRPTHRRGQATKPLRETARARFEEDPEYERKIAFGAVEALKNLPRHLKVLKARGWLPEALPE